MTRAEYRAHFAVRQPRGVEEALRKGKLQRASQCESCGKSGSWRLRSSRGKRGHLVYSLHAHHDDYNFRVSVRWLCQRCHRLWHCLNEPVREGQAS